MYKFYIALAFISIISLTVSVPEDENVNCLAWASTGECENNPGYMLVSCATSCANVARHSNSDIPPTFYDIVEKDISGMDVYYSQFRGKLVYIVNVASYCGYTAENYALLRSLKKYRPYGFEILIFPCNQFGGQEPGDSNAILDFVAKQDIEGIILSKSDVMGSNTATTFKYLKARSGKVNIKWNFDGKFLVDQHGHVNIATDTDVEAEVRMLLGLDEL